LKHAPIPISHQEATPAFTRRSICESDVYALNLMKAPQCFYQAQK
jgi:hypothetical protein